MGNRLRVVLFGLAATACTIAGYPRLQSDEVPWVLEAPGVTATFGPTETGIRLARGRTSLRLRSVGRGTARENVPEAGRVTGGANEVRLMLGGGVEEWWRTTARGLEHGVTLEERPAGDGILVLSLRTGSGAHPDLSADGAVELRDDSGAVFARYSDLQVLDVNGARVPARLAVADGAIQIEVEDAGARYPLVVDPLLVAVLEAEFQPLDPSVRGYFGESVALSSDGSRAIIGAGDDDPPTGANAGSARVYVRTGTAWAEEAVLLATDGAAEDGFGVSVAISGDGTRVLIGARGDDTTAGANAGSARVFVRGGAGWTEEASLTPVDGAAGDGFGAAVALDANGDRAAVGAYLDDTISGVNAGSVRVFLRTGAVWAEEGTLLAPGAGPNDRLGYTLAMSADGSRVLVGPYGEDSFDRGDDPYARVFARSGATWSHEATLSPAGSVAQIFCDSVALSADGAWAVLGLPYDAARRPGAGGARVFARTGTSWGAARSLYASVAADFDRFGDSVAVNADGTRIAVGAWADSDREYDSGSGRVFERTGVTWTEAAVFAGDTVFANFGVSIAMSADGERVLIGAPWRGSGSDGTARIYNLSPAAVLGSPCAAEAECLSGNCVDGVCCDSTCGGGVATDCRACSAALTGGADGTCAPLAAHVASTVVCRTSTVLCDAAEVCLPTSTDCPSDAYAPSDTVCRAAAGACDAEERCTGTSTACPADRRFPRGTACGGSVVGSCSTPGVCDGSSVSCPGATPLPSGTICQPADPASPCDVPDVCDGLTDACAPRFAAAGTRCAASRGGICDVPDECSGMSGDCPETYAMGIVCRPSVDPSCDAPEQCDGSGTECPMDLTTCVAAPDAAFPDSGIVDASLDAARPIDASSPDAGPGVGAAGCGCRGSSGNARGTIGLLGLGLVLVVLRRSR